MSIGQMTVDQMLFDQKSRNQIYASKSEQRFQNQQVRIETGDIKLLFAPNPGNGSAAFCAKYSHLSLTFETVP